MLSRELWDDTPLATANVSLFGPTIDEFLNQRPGFHYLWTPGVR